MRSIWNRAHLRALLSASARFLVVWLASALLVWSAIRLVAWSGIVLGQGGKPLLLGLQPPLASLLMAWWRWSPVDAPDDVMLAMAKGMGTAVLVMWVSLLAPLPTPLPVIPIAGGDIAGPAPEGSIVGFLGGLVLVGVVALLTGAVGGLMGVLVAKHVQWNLRWRRPGVESAH